MYIIKHIKNYFLPNEYLHSLKKLLYEVTGVSEKFHQQKSQVICSNALLHMGQMANGGNTSWMVAAAFIQLSHFKPG
jgi:hypothetical protein